MKRTFVLALLVVACGFAASAQGPGCPGDVPKETVDALWSRGARGDLLTPKGWAEASAFFVQPGPPLDGSGFQVFSEYYGVNFYSIDGATARVQMEFTDLGKIDSVLRYKPPPETRAYKTSMEFRLVSGPQDMLMYGPDGRTLVEKKEIPGVTVWRIEGRPFSTWTTVNAAIRYVVEKRSEASDPDIRKNTDKTLSKLLQLH